MPDRGPRTRRRGSATRERILAAATDLFCRDGYVTTTMAGIAAEAGVAVQTLYLAYGSKVAILAAAHDVAIVGDAEPVPLLERDWVERTSQARSVAAGWEQAAEELAPSTERVAPIYAVIAAAAADPDVAGLLADLREQRHRNSQAVARLLLDLPVADPDADPDRVADILYAVLSAETYALLVTERGWTARQWRAWVDDIVVRELEPS